MWFTGAASQRCRVRRVLAACGHANKRHDTRAIRDGSAMSIISTAVYTALAPNHFKDCWRD
jgi:hypothetical protein